MTVDCYFELYHETFHIREDGENIFSHRGVQGPLDRLTRFSAVGENAAHGQCHSITTEPDSALSRPPRSPLYLVPGADEEASRRRQAVRPLHLPEVRLPTHNQARPKTTQPHALAGYGKTISARKTSMGWAYLSNIDFSEEELRPIAACSMLKQAAEKPFLQSRTSMACTSACDEVSRARQEDNVLAG